MAPMNARAYPDAASSVFSASSRPAASYPKSSSQNAGGTKTGEIREAPVGLADLSAVKVWERPEAGLEKAGMR